MEQSNTDPCLFYKKKDGKLWVMIAVYVDDCLIAGPPKALKWLKDGIRTRFNIDDMGKLKKHLGVWYDWKEDNDGEVYLTASMPKMADEIGAKFEEAMGHPARLSDLPASPGTVLAKNEGNIVHQTKYRSLIGKMLFYSTKIAPKIANAVRELATHMDNPGEEHWAAAKKLTGYIIKHKDEGLTI